MKIETASNGQPYPTIPSDKFGLIAGACGNALSRYNSGVESYLRCSGQILTESQIVKLDFLSKVEVPGEEVTIAKFDCAIGRLIVTCLRDDAQYMQASSPDLFSRLHELSAELEYKLDVWMDQTVQAAGSSIPDFAPES